MTCGILTHMPRLRIALAVAALAVALVADQRASYGQ